MVKQVTTKILLRNDTAANWTNNNPVLGKGEIGIESDTHKFKFGDGTLAWASLSYAGASLTDVPMASASANGLMAKEDYSKLYAIEAEAQVNVIELVKVNGNALSVTNKGINIIVPTGTLASKDAVTQSDIDAAFAAVLSGLRTDVNAKAASATTLSGYGITDAYTKSEVDGLVAAVLHYKGAKATTSELPQSDSAVIGDVWHVTGTGGEYAWDGTEWQELGSSVDMSAYATVASVTSGLGNKVDKVTGKSLVLDTEIARLGNMATGATKTAASSANGKVKINDVDTTVYTLPSTVVNEGDVLILNGGAASTTYS